MIQKMRNLAIRIAVILLVAITVIPAAEAQCPMCKIGAESNLKNGGTAGSGLNTGILYMLAMPYLLVGAIGFAWHKNRKKDSELSDS